MSEAETAKDTATATRLRTDVLELQARRLELDRRRDATTFLHTRRASTATPAGGTP
jgi:hypothetical protein